MDAAGELGEFLRTRRAKITPERAGLPGYGARRVDGLRREEVASLSGVSADYYRRIERGLAAGVSDDVLAAIARALELDGAERAHLHDLSRVGVTTPPTPPGAPVVRPALLRMLSTISAPAFLLSRASDFLAANPLGRALYAPIFDGPLQPANFARFCFLDPAAGDFYVDWERNCHDVVAHLRSEAGRAPRDRELSALIGELSVSSPRFADLWATHDVRHHRSGTKVVRHPDVGLVELDYEVLQIPADEGRSVSVYGTAPGSDSERALARLASRVGP